MRFAADFDLSEPRLRAVNVGRPAQHSWDGGTVTTAIWKRPVTGRRRVTRLNVDGDEQADKQGHGGEHRAVMLYQLDSYVFWERLFGRDDFEWGQFGENFTVTGLADEDVCVGDHYRIGSALFEVTQPRVTCYRVGIRLRVPEMAALLVQHRRPGFYLRVLEEGDVGAGDAIRREYRPAPTLSVADIDALLYLPHRSVEDLRISVQIDALSQGWRGSLQDLLDDAEAEADPRAKFAWEGFAPMRVVDVVAETPEIRSIVLAPPSSADGLPPFRPGQHLTIRVPTEEGRLLIRNYSLSSAPDADHYRISIKRETLGKVSGWLHARLRAGMTLEAATPRGEFALQSAAEPVVLASAGIGVTPVLAMLADLAGRQTSHRVIWLQVCRTPSERPFTAEVRNLVSQLPDAEAHVFYTGASADVLEDGSTPDFEHAFLGRPSVEALRELGIAPGSHAYVCGPSGFMSAISAALVETGLPIGHIHSEAFGPSQIGQASTVAPHQPAGSAGAGPNITFSRSGLTTIFDGRFANLLELAEACDIPVHWSCRTGVCQSCVTPLVAGAVSYQPEPVDDPAKGTVLLCCSHPRSDLVLDA